MGFAVSFEFYMPSSLSLSPLKKSLSLLKNSLSISLSLSSLENLLIWVGLFGEE